MFGLLRRHGTGAGGTDVSYVVRSAPSQVDFTPIVGRPTCPGFGCRGVTASHKALVVMGTRDHACTSAASAEE